MSFRDGWLSSDVGLLKLSDDGRWFVGMTAEGELVIVRPAYERKLWEDQRGRRVLVEQVYKEKSFRWGLG